MELYILSGARIEPFDERQHAVNGDDLFIVTREPQAKMKIIFAPLIWPSVAFHDVIVKAYLASGGNQEWIIAAGRYNIDRGVLWDITGGLPEVPEADRDDVEDVFEFRVHTNDDATLTLDTFRHVGGLNGVRFYLLCLPEEIEDPNSEEAIEYWALAQLAIRKRFPTQRIQFRPHKTVPEKNASRGEFVPVSYFLEVDSYNPSDPSDESRIRLR